MWSGSNDDFNPIIIIRLFITLKFIAIKTTVLAHITPKKNKIKYEDERS